MVTRRGAFTGANVYNTEDWAIVVRRSCVQLASEGHGVHVEAFHPASQHAFCQGSSSKLCRPALQESGTHCERRKAEACVRMASNGVRVVEWKEDWAQAWLEQDVDVGSRREEEFADGHEACLTKEGGVQDNELVKVFVQR